MTNNPFDLLKKKSPRRRLLEIGAVAGSAALLTGGAIFGINSANDYRATVESAQADAEQTAADTAEQVELAQGYADAAQEAADAAAEAVTAAEAAEAAAAAQAASDAAALAAEEAAAAASPGSEAPASGSGTCPGGTTMIEGDENGATGCLPDYCMGALPDPVPAECSVIIRP